MGFFTCRDEQGRCAGEKRQENENMKELLGMMWFAGGLFAVAFIHDDDEEGGEA